MRKVNNQISISPALERVSKEKLMEFYDYVKYRGFRWWPYAFFIAQELNVSNTNTRIIDIHHNHIDVNFHIVYRLYSISYEIDECVRFK